MRKVIIARNRGIKLPVTWNDMCQPIDPGKDNFVGYNGKVAQDIVSITCADFRHVPREQKQLIWDDIFSTFDIEPNKQRYVLQEVARFSRNCRSFLTRKFIYDRNGNLCINPHRKYNIDVDTWRKFVKIRTTEQFQRLSNAQRARAQNRLHLYRGSRLGLARIEQIEEKRRQAAGEECTEVPRHEVWRIVQENQKGQIDNANVKNVVDNMESLSQSDPSLVLQSQLRCRNDLLALALEKPEHPVRIRAWNLVFPKRNIFD